MDNGDSGELVPARVSTLHLTFTPHTGALVVDGSTATVDEALNMLAQAARYFEDQRRMQNIQAMQAATMDAQRVAAIRATIKH